MPEALSPFANRVSFYEFRQKVRPFRHRVLFPMNFLANIVRHPAKSRLSILAAENSKAAETTLLKKSKFCRLLECNAFLFLLISLIEYTYAKRYFFASKQPIPRGISISSYPLYGNRNTHIFQLINR